MDFLSSSSIIMQRPSFPEKKMKGMWQAITIMNEICTMEASTKKVLAPGLELNSVSSPMLRSTLD
jgi:hypothetical protein